MSDGIAQVVLPSQSGPGMPTQPEHLVDQAVLRPQQEPPHHGHGHDRGDDRHVVADPEEPGQLGDAGVQGDRDGSAVSIVSGTPTTTK